MRDLHLVLAWSLAATAPAYANDHTEQLLAAEGSTRLVAGLGARVGAFRAGATDDEAFGLGIEVGVRFDRLALFGEYGHLWLTSVAPSAAGGRGDLELSGHSEWIGGLARYSVLRSVHVEPGGGSLTRYDVFVEAGIGADSSRWTSGSIAGPGVELGGGVQLSGRGTHGRSRGYGGVVLDARIVESGAHDRSVVGSATFFIGG